MENDDFADHLKPMILLSLNTGIRRGELFRIKWKNIDFNTEILTVPGEIRKGFATVHIPLNNTTLSTLKKWKKQSGEKESEELVFPSKGGQTFNNVTKSWKRLLEEAEIVNFRWHDMRHDFASQLAMNGVDLNTIRELLGHADIKMTQRYSHLAPHIKAKAVAKLDQLGTQHQKTRELENSIEYEKKNRNLLIS